jgi:hypothetical protein
MSLRMLGLAMVCGTLFASGACVTSDDDDSGSAGNGGVTDDGETAGTAGESPVDHGAAGGAGKSPVNEGTAGTAGTAGSHEVAGRAGASAAGGPSAEAGGGGAASGGAAPGAAGEAGAGPQECPTFRRGVSTGDPHLITFDGLYYDFQAAGEFVLARSNDLIVQIRNLPTPDCAAVAFGKAIALESTETKVSIHADTERFVRLGDGRTFRKGPIDLELEDWSFKWECDALWATSSAGDVVIVQSVDDLWLDVEVRPAAGAKGLGGLLGDRNSSTKNDIALSDGTVIDEDPVSWETLYGDYAENWRVTAETSLFVYDEGETAETYARWGKPGMPDLSSADEDRRSDAEAACDGIDDAVIYQGCLVDAVCGGATAESAAAWFQSDPEPEQVLEVSEPQVPVECYETGSSVLDHGTTVFACPLDCQEFGFIWGTDIYTDDSSICAAAVHAGILAPDSTEGYVSVVEEPGQDQYVGSTRNGITTDDYGEWPRSFSVAAAEPDPCGLPLGALMAEEADQATFTCPNDCPYLDDPDSYRVWGSGPYGQGSQACAAAIHAGVIDADTGGTVVITRVPSTGDGIGSVKNGIEAREETEYWLGDTFDLSAP